ncbi:MAG: peptide deformylase [Patescibacteria group bacterium]|nr:peptide deformylase [Patescibacteria group bacterium]
MNKYKLVTTKDRDKIPVILREKSKPVTKITPELLDLAKQMTKIMKANKGIGISAIQVGVPVRMIVLSNCDMCSSDQCFIFINPEIKRVSRREAVFSEGCLSFPDIFEDISRPEKVVVKAKNTDWEDVEIEAEGLMARCLEHEIDHLEGVLFIDYVRK